MRVPIQLLYRLRRFLLRVLRMRTRGVKVLLFNDRGELLLIRNRYGNRQAFVLPGGGIGRSETPAAAAAREVKEEVGLTAKNLSLLSTHVSTAEGKRDTIFLYRAEADGEPMPDGIEVEEARFFPLTALPATVSAAAVRRIDEYRVGRSADGPW